MTAKPTTVEPRTKRTIRRIFIVGAVAVTAVGVLVLGGLARAESPLLQGSVGPSYVISLKDAAGARVVHIDPGAYGLQVADLSDEHSFHLQGPGGVDAGTDVEGMGTKTFSITLVDGVYAFFCDEHPTRMHGQFAVGTATLPKPPPPAPQLALTVTNTAVTLRKAGVVVTSLASGAYVVKVTDRSKTQNAHLLGAGVNRKTGIRFVGSVSWKVTLSSGTLVYRSDAVRPKLRAGQAKVS